MATPEETIQTLKEKTEKDKDKLLRMLFVDDPMPLLHPQSGMSLCFQLVMGVRGSIDLLKRLDPNYVIDAIKIPAYIG